VKFTASSGLPLTQALAVSLLETDWHATLIRDFIFRAGPKGDLKVNRANHFGSVVSQHDRIETKIV
jgi:hypothetical protein